MRVTWRLAQTTGWAVPGRSASDLVAALVHDCEAARAKDRHGALILMDIRGGFNAVQHRRMANRLASQGWGPDITSWVKSWATGRTAFATGEQEYTMAVPLTWGLPQGSPLSPAVFLLYLAPLFGTGYRSWFGYVDDVAVYHSSRSPAQAGHFAAEDANRCVQWLEDNGVPVDPAKTEFLRLAKGLKVDSAPVTLKGYPRPVAST